MPRKPEHQAGHDFEERFADLFQAELQPGSGNQWFAKLDVRGRSIIWSLKSAPTKKSITITKAILLEAISHATKLGSPGAIPGWATEVEGEAFITLRAQDLALLFQEDIRLVTPTRGDERRARSKMPVALRKELEEGAND